MSERFFSRITLRDLAADSTDFWKVFRDPYSLHQSIWALFSDGPDRGRDFLYHVADTTRPPVIYAVSDRQPSTSDSLWHVDVKDYRPRLSVGMRLEFYIRANPVVTREGKRHDVVMDAKTRARSVDETKGILNSQAEIVQEACGAWLQRRPEAWGFRLLMVRADSYRQHFFSKRKQQRPIKFSTVDFSGALEVLDADKFRATLHDGIGHAKGFGCGMLMIKRMTA